jgi:hypothetical protein
MPPRAKSHGSAGALLPGSQRRTHRFAGELRIAPRRRAINDLAVVQPRGRWPCGQPADHRFRPYGKTWSPDSRLQEQAAAQTTQATRYDVILGVNRAYFGVLESQALVRVAQETVNRAPDLTDQVTALGNAQLKSQVDVSFAQVNLSEAQLMLIRARTT